MPPGALPRDPRPPVASQDDQDDNGLGFYRGLMICLPPMLALEGLVVWWFLH